MLAESFLEQMTEIVKYVLVYYLKKKLFLRGTSLSRSCSPTRQTMFFSATLTTEVEGLAQISLKKPARLFLDSNKVR